MFKSASSKSAAKAPTILSEGVTVTGEIISDGEVLITGIVNGDISAKSLTIGLGGSVDGTVTAEVITVAGSLSGRLMGGAVTLTPTAKVTAEVIQDSLTIEPGAHLEGASRRPEPATDQLLLGGSGSDDGVLLLEKSQRRPR